MTIFAIIEPKLRRIQTGDFPDYKAAVVDAGLSLGELDFDTIARWKDGRTLSIIVYEYGLIKGKSNPEGYFSFDGRLFNGNAVIFMADEEGETIDLNPNLAKHLESNCTHFKWFANSTEVEAAIIDGQVHRPQSAVNDEVFWEWKP